MKKAPLVRGDRLFCEHADHEHVLAVETPAWFAWLETASTFLFIGEAGTFTARKERAGNRRGGWYWKAYRTQHGQHASRYLGKSDTLTLARLQAVAQVLADALIKTTPDVDAALPSARTATPEMRRTVPPSLLATKLYRPPPRAHLVRRPQLTARLTQGSTGPLTLIAAPAGFGKTTLISAWLAESDLPAAWLSLDEGDNDPTRLLLYLIAAMQTIAVSIGAEVVRAIQSPQPPPIDVLLTTLLNDITHIPGPFVLVLDDYHLIDAPPVNQALTFLLDHLPAQMHVVIITRQDPPLPLARWRARAHLTEVRATDLRFSSAEAADFLNVVMNLHLSAADIAALDRRTEGWIAGLHLAALSLQGHPDAAGFIASFTGSHRFVLDYLVEEVLQQQPKRIQTFLLRTSILERLCGPICDAVVGDAAVPGQATLESLEHANLFLVPLDHERRWYRYHHLFAELLRQRLISSAEEADSQVNALHIRASAWYEGQNLELAAFHHATAAQDAERAERLIEGKGMPLHFRGAVVPVLHWLKSLPKTALDARPALWTAYASTLLATGQVTEAEQKLHAAEAALQGTELDSTIKDLIGRIAAIRATVATSQNQLDAIIAQSRRALEYLHPDNLAFRTSTAWKLGFAYQLQGDRAAARRAYTEVIAIGQASGNTTFTLMATIGLGNIQEGDNQLHLAAQTYHRVLQLLGDEPLPPVCEAHLGLARICYEWNDLEAATQHVQQSLPLVQQIENSDRRVACDVLLARLKLAQGDAAGAAALLVAASQSARQQHFVQHLPEVVAAQVRTLLRQGNLAGAAHLTLTHNLPLSQALVHLAQGEPSASLMVLSSWRRQVEAKGWEDERLKALVIEALALQEQGDQDQAVSRLGDALVLAELGGFIRLFIDEGRPMAQLLSVVAAQGRMPDYIGTLLAAWKAEEQQREAVLHLSLAHSAMETLSPREREVLQLIAQGLSNQEISERLVLAVTSVKGHNRHIFGKLQVQRRTEAVARARELGLL